MTRNSETNDPSPGNARPDMPEMRNTPATAGVIFCQPPKSEMRVLPRRRTSIAATRKSPAVVKPWLIM